MKERPILFSAPMVRAILDGSKTQTRRILKVQPTEGLEPPFEITNTVVDFWKEEHLCKWVVETPDGEWYGHCPYGKPGDRLWVREMCIISPPNWADRDMDLYNVTDKDGNGRICQYIATSPDTSTPVKDYKLKITPSIHMPRWASRINLEVESVRVERLQDISEADAREEGCSEVLNEPRRQDVVKEYEYLWNKINGPGSWEANPWVWVITFKRIIP